MASWSLANPLGKVGLEYQIMQRNHPLLTLSLKFCASLNGLAQYLSNSFRSSELERKPQAIKIITGLDV
jgi:hypothetical protein